MSLEGLLAPGADGRQSGATFTTRGRTITESDLVSFAALTGDWHPQHADASWAAAGRFGERVAHGMMLVSYSVGLVAFDPERVVALRGLDAVVFKRPVSNAARRSRTRKGLRDGSRPRLKKPSRSAMLPPSSERSAAR